MPDNVDIAQVSSWLLYGAPFALILVFYIRKQSGLHRQNASVRDAAIASGLTEPASLHPVIDPNRCIGCSACIAACPEMPHHKVLGLIHGKAELISPTECIGHGACLAACPADAITLVFGTERRGIDIPFVKPTFETNVAGIYIAGELGGMGLIRNAIEQGCQAIKSMAKDSPPGSPDVLDVVIVGAGPAGFAASLAAKAAGMSAVTIEQETLGGTVAHYPRGKLVMTSPAHLPLVGKFQFRETTKEKLLEFWQKVERDTGVIINYQERVEAVTTVSGNFSIQTTSANYRARHLLLTIGRRGTPRKLDVPGEELPKVIYRLIDPEQYAGQRVLVVGGGDSALEAACEIADQPATEVVLSYRSEAFSRAKTKNRARVEAAEANGQLRVILNSNVKSITPDSVHIEHLGEMLEVANDAVIISAGGILPTALLRSLGIMVETKYGTA